MIHSVVNSVRSPYPGLRPFRPDEADLFFGRDEQIDQLLARLGRSRFLAVVGESGCGKSSLILAGMVPALETGFLDSAGADWTIARMRPGSQPMRNLASALLDSSAIASTPDRPREDQALIEAELRRGPLGLLDVLDEGSALGDSRLLLLVDQFEEIFRFRRNESPGKSLESQEVDRNEASAFVALLLRTIREPEGKIYVVLTMRSDFLGDCAIFSGLPEALNDCQFLTPRLTFDQRKIAIEGPARVEGGSVAPELTTALLNDMGSGPDQLPLMQHALMRAWSVAQSRAPQAAPRVAVEDYIQVGRLKEALSLHADAAFDELRPDQRPIAERLFRALTGGNTGKRDTRRPTKLGEVAAIAGVEPEKVAEVIEHFRGGDRNFLTPAEGPLGSDDVIDLSHESLIRQWGRLRTWSEAEAKSAETYRLLERTASDKKQPWVGVDLDDILRWRKLEQPNAVWASRYGGDFVGAMAFIDAGIDRQKKLEEDARSANRREQQVRLFKLLGGIAILVILLTGALAAWALSEQRKAIQNEEIARVEKKKADNEAENARKSEKQARNSEGVAKAAQKLADERKQLAVKQTERTNALILASKAQEISGRMPIRSLLLASEALKSSVGENQSLNVEAETVLRRVLGTLNQFSVKVPQKRAQGVAVSPDGKVIAVGMNSFGEGDGGNHVSLYDATARPPTLLGTLPVSEGAISRSIEFSRDGRYLAAGYSAKKGGSKSGVVVWEMAKRRRLTERPIVLKVGDPTELTFHPSAARIAIAYADVEKPAFQSGVGVWSVDGQGPAELSLPSGECGFMSVAYSPDGLTLAAGYAGVKAQGVGGVYLINESTRQPLTGQPLPVKEGGVSSVSFSPDGKTLAAAAFQIWNTGTNSPGAVVLWDVIHNSRLGDPLPVKEGPVSMVRFDSTGKTLASSYENAETGGVILWDLANRTPQSVSAVLAALAPVSGLAYGPGNRFLCIQDGDGFRVCDLISDPLRSVEPRALNLPPGPEARIAASPDGNWVVEALPSRARVWKLPLADGKNPGPIQLNLEGLRLEPRVDEVEHLGEILFDPDSRRMVIAGPRDLLVWDCQGSISPRPRCVIHASGDARFDGLKLSRGGRWLVARHWSDPGRVSVYDLEAPGGARLFTVWLKLPAAVVRQRVGQSPARSDDAKTPTERPEPSKSAPPAPPSPATPPAVPRVSPILSPNLTAFSEDGRRLAVSNLADEIKLFDLDEIPGAALPSRSIRPTGEVIALAFHPDGDALVALVVRPASPAKWKTEAWTIPVGEEPPTADPSHSIQVEGNNQYTSRESTQLKFTPDGSFLGVVTEKGFVVRQWKADGDGVNFESFSKITRPSVVGGAFSPDSRWLMFSGNFVSGSLVSLPEAPGPFKPFDSPASFGPLIDFSRDSRLLATTSFDDSAVLLDVETWTSIYRDGEPPPPVRRFPGFATPPLKVLRLTPDASQLVTVGSDSTIRVWRMSPEKLVEIARSVAGRNLTEEERRQYFPGLLDPTAKSSIPE